MTREDQSTRVTAKTTALIRARPVAPDLTSDNIPQGIRMNRSGFAGGSNSLEGGA
jgi:hypothetical protein